jgi:hypothetical protein
MKLTDAFPSNYLKAGDLDEDQTYTIAGVTIETLGQGKNAEQKPVLSFKETDKTFVLNKTNGKTISSLYGDEMDDWTGKKITLFATEVEFQGEQTLAIRVRLKKPVQLPPRPTKAPVSDPLAGNPKQSAYKAFLDKWNEHEAGNPDDAPLKQERWTQAQETYFTENGGKKPATATADDWTAFAAKLVKDYDAATGGFIPF